MPWSCIAVELVTVGWRLDRLFVNALWCAAGEGLGQATVQFGDESNKNVQLLVQVIPNSDQRNIAKRMAAEQIPKGMRVVKFLGAVVSPLELEDRVDVVAVSRSSSEGYTRIVSGVQVFSIDSLHRPYLLLKVEDANQLASAQSDGTLMVFPTNSDETKEPFEASEFFEDDSLSMELREAPIDVEVFARLAMESASTNEAHQNTAAQKVLAVFEQLFPKEKIGVLALKQGVVISGDVDPEIQKLVLQIAEDYFPNVVNNLSFSELDSKVTDKSFSLEDERPRNTNVGSELKKLRGDVQDLRGDVERLIEAIERVRP